MTATPSTPPDPAGGARDVVVHVVGRTDVGRTREHNEDAFAVARLGPRGAGDVDPAADDPDPEPVQPDGERVMRGDGALFMVADGMGGAAAGEIASSMAVDVVVREIRQRWRDSGAVDAETFAAALRAATAEANAHIHQFATQHPEYRGMGTTATIAALLGDMLYLAQVGDSRAYLVRDGIARQITKDQSLMQKLIEAGEITAEEAEVSDRRNIILQALGPEAVVKVDLTHQRIRRGDTLILCSDGLSGQVRADEIATTAMEEHDLERVCQRLIDLANASGGPDNITVVAARFHGEGLEVAASDDEVGHRVFPVPGDDATPVLPVERYVRRSGPGVRSATATAAPTDAAQADPLAAADAAPESGQGDAAAAATSAAPAADAPGRRPIPVPGLIALGVLVALALLIAILQLQR
ncbi:MAG: PP2C family protein-serine/threonine phosphatase [Gemmatimonadaceae bacterium]